MCEWMAFWKFCGEGIFEYLCEDFGWHLGVQKWRKESRKAFKYLKDLKMLRDSPLLEKIGSNERERVKILHKREKLRRVL